MERRDHRGVLGTGVWAGPVHYTERRKRDGRVEAAAFSDKAEIDQLRVSPAESALPNPILPFGDGLEMYHHGARCTIV
jgi:hypothetical protein